MHHFHLFCVFQSVLIPASHNIFAEEVWFFKLEHPGNFSWMQVNPVSLTSAHFAGVGHRWPRAFPEYRPAGLPLLMLLHCKVQLRLKCTKRIHYIFPDPYISKYIIGFKSQQKSSGDLAHQNFTVYDILYHWHSSFIIFSNSLCIGIFDNPHLFCSFEQCSIINSTIWTHCHKFLNLQIH